MRDDRFFTVPQGFVVSLFAIVLAEPSFTALGHRLAFGLGLACYSVTRSPAVQERSRGPIYPYVWQQRSGRRRDDG